MILIIGNLVMIKSQTPAAEPPPATTDVWVIGGAQGEIIGGAGGEEIGGGTP